MRHGARTLRVKAVLVLVAASLTMACEDQAVLQPGAEPAFAVNPAAGQSPLMKQVRQATARFNSIEQARQAGYAPASPCIEVPGVGGMGVHYVNQGLVDPVFDPLAPEALVYFPEDYGFRLVAVEYIVINAGQPAPTFESQAFDVGGTPVPVSHWSLHLWLYENNPAGEFAPFNPDVVCPAGAPGGAAAH